MTRLLALLALLPLAVSAQSPIPDGTELELIANGFQFTEGPLWVDGGILFSDIPANTIYRWSPGGGVEVFRSPSQKSNGLVLDGEGRLLIAQHGARRVARLEDGTEVALATAYDGKALNSPNDLAVHPDGSIYFTDPTWGLEGRPAELGFTGVYRLDTEGDIHLLASDLNQPNGIAFSPDLATLYVTTSNERTVVAYDLADGEVSNGRVFARLTGGAPNDAADGMVVGTDGTLFVAGPSGPSESGVVVFAPDGTRLDAVAVPGQTTNVTFGDDDGRALYITSGPGVYRLRLGDAVATEPSPEAGFRIEAVAPNPSAETATVVVHLDKPRTTTLAVLDALGREVHTVRLGGAAGEHRVEVDVRDLTAGVYVVRLGDGAEAITRALTVAR